MVLGGIGCRGIGLGVMGIATGFTAIMRRAITDRTGRIIAITKLVQLVLECRHFKESMRT